MLCEWRRKIEIGTIRVRSGGKVCLGVYVSREIIYASMHVSKYVCGKGQKI